MLHNLTPNFQLSKIFEPVNLKSTNHYNTNIVQDKKQDLPKVMLHFPVPVIGMTSTFPFEL